MNYYNEFDPKAAGWLRELIKQNLIPNGHVDERSIVDVRGSDLEGYTQCHFFAGIGGWPLALRLAGWPEDRQVWTGSCPCQPFSNAGLEGHTGDGYGRNQPGRDAAQKAGHSPTTGSPWNTFELLECRDWKTRRIEPGLVPLAHGIPARVVPSGDPGSPEYAQNTGEARVMRIRGYGNSIVPQLAAKFVTAFLEVNHAH